MKYNIMRIPKTDESLAAAMEELAPFLEGMYTAQDVEVHGPMAFDMGHWLFLWDSGAGFVLTARDDAGELVAAAICTRFRCLWSGKLRVEVHRFAFRVEDNDAALQQVEEMTKYLLGVESVLEFDEVYILKRTEENHEVKELIWRKLD